MDKASAAAAPDTPDVPTFETLAADPEIAPLLEFEPVPRQIEKANGWTPAAQRIFIAWLAHYGSPTNACLELGMARSGIDKIHKAAGADEFRESWDAAIALYEKRRIALMASRHGGNGSLRAPTPSRGRVPAGPAPLAPGQVYNEHGEPEDEASFNQRGEDARFNIAEKLLRCRRHLLLEISGDPGKRAAFELLTELPIDWEKAARLEPQADEPWRRPRMLQPDMVVTAETGWFGTIVPDYGPDKIGQLRRAINEARAERGLCPIEEWSESAERSDADATASPEQRERREACPGGGARDTGRANPSDESCGFIPHDQTAPPAGPPPMRSFGLNSPEAYEAVAGPQARPWIPNGALPRTPRTPDPQVIVERQPPANGKRK